MSQDEKRAGNRGSGAPTRAQKGTSVIDSSTFDVVKATVVETLELQDREATISPDTLLFGSMPELDSLALVDLITALEGRFGFEMDGEDISAAVFESVGSLAAHIEQRLS
jgi:acyl carrier protein